MKTLDLPVCLSWRMETRLVKHGQPSQPHPITTTPTHAHPDTLVSLRGQLCEKLCIPVSKALELEVAAAAAAEVERLKDQS